MRTAGARARNPFAVAAALVAAVWVLQALVGAGVVRRLHQQAWLLASDAARLKAAALAQELEGPAEASVPGATHLRRLALASGLAWAAVTDASGRVLASSGPPWGPVEKPGSRSAVGRAGAVPGGLFVRRPLGPAKGSAGAVLEVLAVSPELESADRLVRGYLLLQCGLGVLAMGGVLWMRRRHRRLWGAGPVPEAPESGAAEAGASGEMAETIRRVVHKFRTQEQALDEVARRPGLGEAVRFAQGPGSRLSTGVVVLDSKGRVAAMNPAAAAALGVRPDGCAGRALGASDPRLRPLAGRVAQVLLEGRVLSREVVEIQGADGEAIHLGVSATTISGYGGGAGGAVVLVSDLTEIRRMQEQARLREGLAFAGRLAAGMAHEFRNALGTILGHARMLHRHDDPRVRLGAEEILEEVTSIRAAVEDFLNVARPQEGPRERVDLGRLIRRVARGTPQGVDLRAEGTWGEVEADPNLLRRAVDNLIRNAVEAVSDRPGPRRVRVKGRLDGDRLRQEIVVEDNGPGIPPDLREQVFVPFFTTKAGGTGLGLALVHRIVADLGGSVEIGESALGGARIRIEIPLARPAEARRAAGGCHIS